MDAVLRSNTTNDINIAKNNRLLLEAADRLDLLEGNIEVDQAPAFKWGAEITGHRNGSIITNNYYGATYALNTCGMLVGQGIDYVNPYTKIDDTVIQSENAKKYHNDNVLYFWKWDAYISGPPQLQRNRIVNVNKSTGEVQLALPVPDGVDRLKLIDAYECADYPAGQGFIETPYAEQFKTRKELFFTMGPKQANECYGVYLDIAGVDLDKGRIYIKTPVPESYTQCAIVKVRTAKRNVFNNVTFGIPTNRASHSFFGTQIRDASFNNCRALWGPFAFGNSEGLLLNNVEGSVALNQAIRSWVTGGAYNVAYEEGCYDSVITSAYIFNPQGGQHGIYANGYAPCGRFKILGVKIVNTGFNPGNGNGSPIAGPFHDTTMKDIEIFGCCPGVGIQAYTGGNNLRVENLLSRDAAVSFSGDNISLDNVKAPVVWLGWNNDNSKGVASGCAAILYGTQRSNWEVFACPEYQLKGMDFPQSQQSLNEQLLSNYRRKDYSR